MLNLHLTFSVSCVEGPTCANFAYRRKSHFMEERKERLSSSANNVVER